MLILSRIYKLVNYILPQRAVSSGRADRGRVPDARRICMKRKELIAVNSHGRLNFPILPYFRTSQAFLIYSRI